MPTTPDPARRSERARSAILGAARDLLGEVSYAQLSVEAIAARAGVGKQTIYRWWPSKAAVVFDALLDEAAGADGEVELPDSGDLAADLQELLRGTIAALVEPAAERLQRAVLAEIQHDPALGDELLRRLLRPQLDATAKRIRVAQSAGQVAASVDPALAVELLFGPVFHRWLLRTAPLDDAFADVLAGLVLAGLAPR